MKFRYVMMILILLLLAGVASAWLPGYDYRRGHQILGSTAGHQTDYPVKFIVHRGEGGCNLEYISIDEGKCNVDFSDIRFTGSDETTPLNYWIESVSDSNATIWVEVPFIDQWAGASVYIYYGNSTAVNESNGDATFLFFDDFSGSGVDSGKWTGADAYHEVSGGELILKPGAGSAKYLKSLTDINQRIAIEYTFRQASGLLYFVGINHGDAINTPCIGHVSRTNYESAVGKAYSTTYYVPGRTTSSSNTDGTILSNPGTSWQRMALLEKSGTIDALQDSSLYSYVYTPTTSGKVVINHYSYASGVNGYLDWIAVRGYADPEPEHSVWMGEEDNILEDNIITPDEMPYAITPEVVTEAGTTRFYIGGDKSFDDTALYAVSIQAPDIVLDGGHYTLTGTLDSNEETWQHAINVGNLNNITVCHVNATGWNHGIVFDNVDTGWIDQCNLYENYNTSIAIYSSEAVTIAGNILQNSGENGLYVGDSSDILVTGENVDGTPVATVISGNPAGIFFHNVTQGQILGYYAPMAVESPGEVYSNGWVGLFLSESDNITVKDFTFANQGAGIFSRLSSDIHIGSSNIFYGNQEGVILWGSESCIIEGNMFENNTYDGIQLNWIYEEEIGSKDILILANTILGNNSLEEGSTGIFALFAENITIQENTLINSGMNGIDISECENVTVKFNHIADHMSELDYSGYGISFFSSTRADTFGNELIDNRVGIKYGNTSFNRIWNNTVNNWYDGGEAGIKIWYGSGMTGDPPIPSSPPYSIMRNCVNGYNTGIFLENVTDLLIFDNFFNNHLNYAIGEGTSGIAWNLTYRPAPIGNVLGGPYLGGNFWGNPEGSGFSQTAEDADRDGICDVPYPLGETGYTDYLPLYGGFSAYFTASEYDAVQYGEEPVTIQFYDGSTGDIDLWLWDFGDGEMDDEQNPSHDYTTQGAFYVTLTIINVETEESDEYGTWIHIRPAIPTGVPIWPGWNFISVPRTLAAGNDTVETVFEGVETGGQMVYSYNSSTHAWVAMLPPDDDKILPLDGIWIYSTQVGPFVEFDYSSDFGQVVPRIKHLEPGWNAIGMGSLYPMETASYLASLGNKWDVLLDFNDQLQTYYPPQIRGIQVGGMYPAEGYWIYMNEAGDLLAVTG